jgi:hypothetical protein
VMTAATTSHINCEKIPLEFKRDPVSVNFFTSMEIFPIPGSW